VKASYIYIPLIGLFRVFLSFTAPIVVLLALPFIKWDKEPSVGPQRTNPPTPTIMGDFPNWLSWLSTPDQRLPCDTGIPTCKAWVDRYGKWVAAWLWAGVRNQYFGFAIWLGNQTSNYAPYDIEGYWERTDQYGTIWRYRKTFGKISIMTGYNVYAMLDGSFHTAPILTVKLR